MADTVQPPANMEVRGAPEASASVAETLARYRNARSAALVDWIGDEVLVATRFGDSTQLHRVETPLGMRRQVTFFAEPVRSAAVNPHESEPGFVFLKDIGGSEFYQLFWRPTGGGAAELISDGRSRYTGVSWSPSGRWLGYTTTQRNGRDWDLHARSFDPQASFGETKVVQEGAGVGWSLEDWSAGEDRVLVSKYVSINEAELYEIDLGTGERRQLLPLPDATEGVAIGGAVYGADNGVYYTSDAGSEFMQLRRLDLATGESTTLTEDVEWNVGGAAVSPRSGTDCLDHQRRRLQQTAGGIDCRWAGRGVAGDPRRHRRPAQVLARRPAACLHAVAARGAFGCVQHRSRQRHPDALDRKRTRRLAQGGAGCAGVGEVCLVRWP